MRPVAIFRFSPTEGPGHFGEWLSEQKIPIELIALDEGAAVPVDPGRLFRHRHDGRADERQRPAAVDRAAVRPGARRDRRRRAGDRPLPRRPADGEGARRPRRARADARDRLAARRRLRPRRAPRVVRRPAALRRVPVALRRVRPAADGHARADQRVQRGPGLHHRRPAHRLPVPHRDDARTGRDVVPHRRRRAAGAVERAPAERRRHARRPAGARSRR